MTFKDVAKQHFPGMMAEREFVQQTYRALSDYGFSKGNTIASVGVCRDEMTRSLVSLVEESWGDVFNMSSLAGMLFCYSVKLAFWPQNTILLESMGESGMSMSRCLILPLVRMAQLVSAIDRDGQGLRARVALWSPLKKSFQLVPLV